MDATGTDEGEVRQRLIPTTYTIYLTPKALANSSPGLERSDNPGRENKIEFNPEKGSPTVKPFQGFLFFLMRGPRVVAALQPWAEN